MKMMANIRRIKWSLLAGLVVGLIGMALTVSLASAAPGVTVFSTNAQTTPAAPAGEAAACMKCHPNIANAWANSPHAHAFDDPNFTERWHGLGNQGDCLLCHTTNYQAKDRTYSAPGVSCEACHGKVDPNHPPKSVPIRADTEYCGSCHTTTLGEWRLTGHAQAGVGCTSCHDPHSQQALFANKDEMCINCHKDSMGPYLETTHAKKGIGCVDCHALVIPPKDPPKDGIVPTGHQFTITPATCVACHTDSLHAGFSLPGYEKGAKGGHAVITTTVTTTHPAVNTPEEQIQSLKTQLQTVEAASASRGMSVLFQGGVVGLVLGSSTAWVVAANVRRRRENEEETESEGDDGQSKA